LFRFGHNLYESSCGLGIFSREEGVGKSFGSSTSGTTNSVDVIFDPINTKWHIVVNNNSDILDIEPLMTKEEITKHNQ
jgi:hypothetical protein